MVNLPNIYQSYEEILSDVEGEFNRVRDIFIDQMQCRKGCSSCCNQLFPISAIEAAYISKAVKALDPQEKQEMRRRAAAYLEELLGPEGLNAESIETHSTAVKNSLEKKVGKEHIPCPALKDDACAIYSHRPVMARKFGIPLWNPKKPSELQACELNFKPGEIIEMDGLVEPQINLEYKWLAFRIKLQQDLELPDVVATVASAVLYDYEMFLEDKNAGIQET